MLELSDEASSALNELRSARESLVLDVSKPIELPEPAMHLNLETRAPDQIRMFKHLHQSCLLHTISFAIANRIKLVYLMDAYLWMADDANPIGIYAAARGLLEFAAFTYDVMQRLCRVRDDRSRHWRPRGEEFFGLIVRARFGTSNPTVADLLLKKGFPGITSSPSI